MLCKKNFNTSNNTDYLSSLIETQRNRDSLTDTEGERQTRSTSFTQTQRGSTRQRKEGKRRRETYVYVILILPNALSRRGESTLLAVSIPFSR